MNKRFPFCYLILIYTLLAVFTRASEDSGGALPHGISRPSVAIEGPATRSASVPEPGAIGLVATLVVLLAIQRRRE